MYHSAMIVLFALFQLLCVYSLYSLSRFVAPPWVLPRVLSRGISGGRGAMQQLQQLVPATTSNIGGKVERSEHKANQILQGSETFLNGDNAVCFLRTDFTKFHCCPNLRLNVSVLVKCSMFLRFSSRSLMRRFSRS